MSTDPNAAQRLFIALSPPEPVRVAVAALGTPLRGVRWTPVEQLHVTLRFLGDIAPQVRDSLKERLATIRVEPFILPVEGIGAFPQKGPPRVLWVGVGSGHPRLHQLRQRIDDTLLALGLDVELRAFHPHVTLGRSTENAAAAVNAWVRAHREFAGPVFLVDAFDLYASELYPTGVEHHRVMRFPLLV
jgi:2'-5' RNA ligase